ncbi:MAG TPA: chloride channel protein [Acidobacteriota bacterium]|nr:chloride channel protein [Acidobacteriota bacterium]
MKDYVHRFRAAIRLWRFRLHRANVAGLRIFLKLIPEEGQRVFALTIFVGAICGIAAVAFHLAIHFAEIHLIDRAQAATGYSWIWWVALLPTLGGLVCGILLEFVVPDARGSGIPQVKVAYVVHDGRLPLRTVIGKFLIGTLQIGSGASLGREGPTVQICAGIASLLGQAAALSRQNLTRLLPVGAAAGVAAAFNAPLAAVTFSIEEIVGDLDQTLLSGIVVAAALAAVIEHNVLGAHPILNIPPGYGLHHTSSLLLYVLLGIAAALVSIVFTDLLLLLRRKFRQSRILPGWARPAIGGLVTGVLAVVAILWLNESGVTGGGYETLNRALAGVLDIRVMLALCALKVLATTFSYSSGGAGGIFAPSLFIGAMVGGVIGYLDVGLFQHSTAEIGAFALVGMGAVFAGIIRAPITSVLIIFEMTGSYELVLPLMISNMIAYRFAQKWRPTPVYEALLEQDNIFLPHRAGKVSHALEQIGVEDAMTTDVVTIPGDLSLTEALELMSPYEFATFPVIGNQAEYLGLVSRARVRRNLALNQEKKVIKEIVEDVPTVYPDYALVRAVVIMNSSQIRHLAVIDRGDERRLVGIITMSDVVREQAMAALDLGVTGKSLTPESRLA